MRSLLLSVAFLVLATGLPAGAQAQQSLVAEIAPGGRLRVGFQTGSPILATRAPDGSVSGVVVDLDKFIAQRLGVAFDPVVYVNQEAYAQSFGKDEWDLVIGARSRLRSEQPLQRMWQRLRLWQPMTNHEAGDHCHGQDDGHWTCGTPYSVTEPAFALSLQREGSASRSKGDLHGDAHEHLDAKEPENGKAEHSGQRYRDAEGQDSRYQHDRALVSAANCVCSCDGNVACDGASSVGGC